MPEYVIHIGPPKTASTYLQQIFTASATALREAGVLYPLHIGKPGHVELAKRLAAPDAAEVCKPLFDQFNASDARIVLLSAEDLVTLRPAQAQVLKALIGQNPVTVVYYCRRWSDRMRSMWGEHIKHGAHVSLAAFCADALEAPRKSGLINFGKRLQVWREVFGVAALRIVSFDTLKAEKRELGAHFIETFLGLDLPIPVVEGVANPSLDLVDTEIMRALNGMHWQRTQQKGSTLRRALMAKRRQLARHPEFVFAKCEAAIRAAPIEIKFNETRPVLMFMHRNLFTRFGVALVQPHPEQLFFEPKDAVLRAADDAWMQDVSARAELESAYAILIGGAPADAPPDEQDATDEAAETSEPEPTLP